VEKLFVWTCTHRQRPAILGPLSQGVILKTLPKIFHTNTHKIS